MVLVTAWSVASPVGSVPDSGFHLASIWCSGPRQTASCPIEETIPDQPRAYLPSSLIYPSCFFELPSGKSACTAEITAEGTASVKPNQLVGLNPSGFYSILGLFSGQPAEGRVVLMRVISGCFSAFLIACSAILLRRGERRRFLLLALMAHLPLGLFLASSVNASGTTLAVVIAAVPVGVRLTRAVGKTELAGLLIGATLLIVTAANLRNESPFLVLVVLLALTAQRLTEAFTRTRRTLVVTVTFALTSAITLFYLTDTVGLIDAGLKGVLRTDGAGTLTLDLVLTNATGVFLLWFAAFGGWAPSDVAGLGLMDVVPPWPTSLLTAGVLVTLVCDAKRSSRTIPLTNSIGLFALAWLLPFWTLTISGLRVGEELQPRYILPLLASGVIALALAEPQETPCRTRSQSYTTATLSLAHFLAFGGLVAHYSYGASGLTGIFNNTPSWRWTTTHPLTVVAAGSIAFSVIIHTLSHQDTEFHLSSRSCTDQFNKRGC